MKVKLSLALLLMVLLLAVFAFAEDTTTDTDTTSGIIDTDGDGVVDLYDDCPNTPSGALIILKVSEPIDYLGEFVNRNGCTCEQIREKYLFSENPCVYFECYQDSIFELRNKQYEEGIVICPEDSCDDTNYTYYDYPPSAYSRCDQFKFIEYDCTPKIEMNSTMCGYIEINETETLLADNTTDSIDVNITTNIATDENETFTNETSIVIPVNTFDEVENTTDIVSEGNEFVIPELTGTYKRITHLQQAEIRFAYSEQNILGNDIYFEFLLIHPTNNRTRIQPILYVDEIEIRESIADKSYNNDDGETEFILYTLALPIGFGMHNISLEIKQLNEEPYFFEGTYEVIASEVNIPLVPETKIVATRTNGDLDAEDYAFAKAIHDELILQYVTNNNFEEFNEEIAEATKKLRINKEQVYSEEENTTTFTIYIEPKKNKELYNLTIIEYIPKEIARSAQNIEFTIQPTKILADDPLIMWHFSAVDERIDLEYKVTGNVKATGNTIATVQQGQETGTPWHIVIPVIIIPLLILLLVIFPHMHKHEHKHEKK